MIPHINKPDTSAISFLNPGPLIVGTKEDVHLLNEEVRTLDPAALLTIASSNLWSSDQIHTLIQQDPVRALAEALANIKFTPRAEVVPAQFFDAFVETVATYDVGDASTKALLHELASTLHTLTPIAVPNTSAERLASKRPGSMPSFMDDMADTCDCSETEVANITLEGKLRMLPHQLVIMKLQVFVRDQLRLVDALSEEQLHDFMQEPWGPTKCEACVGSINIPRTLLFLQTLHSCSATPREYPLVQDFAHHSLQALALRLSDVAAETRDCIRHICRSIPMPTLEEINTWHRRAHNVFLQEIYGSYDDLRHRLLQNTSH